MYQKSGIGPRFSPGQVVATPEVLNVIPRWEIMRALARHLRGDWGDCSSADSKQNDVALCCGERLFSVYHATNETKFWIITEADRSATTVLLPEEY
jgi:hypothetical protein